jgi:hypothetical protein
MFVYRTALSCVTEEIGITTPYSWSYFRNLAIAEIENGQKKDSDKKQSQEVQSERFMF